MTLVQSHSQQYNKLQVSICLLHLVQTSLWGNSWSGRAVNWSRTWVFPDLGPVMIIMVHWFLTHQGTKKVKTLLHNVERSRKEIIRFLTTQYSLSGVSLGVADKCGGFMRETESIGDFYFISIFLCVSTSYLYLIYICIYLCIYIKSEICHTCITDISLGIFMPTENPSCRPLCIVLIFSCFAHHFPPLECKPHVGRGYCSLLYSQPLTNTAWHRCVANLY